MPFFFFFYEETRTYYQSILCPSQIPVIPVWIYSIQRSVCSKQASLSLLLHKDKYSKGL